MASNSVKTCSGLSTCGSLRGSFGELTPAAGLESIRPFSSLKRRKLLTVDSLRATVARAYGRTPRLGAFE